MSRESREGADERLNALELQLAKLHDALRDPWLEPWDEYAHRDDALEALALADALEARLDRAEAEVAQQDKACHEAADLIEKWESLARDEKRNSANLARMLVEVSDANEAAESALLALRGERDELKRRCEIGERFLVTAMKQVEEFRRECDPRENMVQVSHEEMYGSTGIVSVIAALAGPDPQTGAEE